MFNRNKSNVICSTNIYISNNDNKIIEIKGRKKKREEGTPVVVVLRRFRTVITGRYA